MNCVMMTLRVHQLRAQLQQLGHPLVGYKLYGDGDWTASRFSSCNVQQLHPYCFGHTLLVGWIL